MLSCHTLSLRHLAKVTGKSGTRALERKGRINKTLGFSSPVQNTWVSKKSSEFFLAWKTFCLLLDMQRSYPEQWGTDWGEKRGENVQELLIVLKEGNRVAKAPPSGFEKHCLGKTLCHLG